MEVKSSLEEAVEQNFTKRVFSFLAVPLKVNDVPTGAIKMVPHGTAERARVMDALDLERVPMSFPVGAFAPKSFEIYSVRLRLKGSYLFCFPDADLDTLRESGEWTPDLWYPEDEFFVLETNERGQISGRHPVTKQRVIPERHLALPEPEEGKVTINMTGKALRPAITAGFWILGNIEDLKRMTQQAIVTYETDNGEHEEKESFAFAKEFYFPAFRENLTVFELAGAPMGECGKPATSLEEFDINTKAWLDRLDIWQRKRLAVALHEANLPDSFSEEERKKAHDINIQTLAAVMEALLWAEGYFKHLYAHLERRKRNGFSLRFELPGPQGRPKKDTIAATTLTKEELREQFRAAVANDESVPTVKLTLSSTKPEKPAPAPKQQTAKADTATKTATKPPAAKPVQTAKSTEATKPAKKPTPGKNGKANNGRTLLAGTNHSDVPVGVSNPTAVATLAELKKSMEAEEAPVKPRRGRKPATSKKRGSDK